MTFDHEQFPVAEPQAPPSRPKSVTIAVRLMYLGAFIEVVRAVGMIFAARRIEDDQAVRDAVREQLSENQSDADLDAVMHGVGTGIVVAAVVFGVIVTGLWIWMAVKNGEGRRWARTTATVFAAIGVVVALFAVSGAAGVGQVIAGAVSLVLAVVILVLLYRPDARVFFSRG